MRLNYDAVMKSFLEDWASERIFNDNFGVFPIENTPTLEERYRARGWLLTLKEEAEELVERERKK